MPRIWKSIPPARSISVSYAAAIAGTSSLGTSPRGRCTHAGSMSTWEKRFSHMKRWKAWMLSGGIGWYSSRLNVSTLRKERPSSRCSRMSSR